MEYRELPTQVQSSKKDKDTISCYLQQTKNVDRVAVWDYKISFWLKYFSVFGVITFIIAQVIYVHSVISFEEHEILNKLPGLPSGIMTAIIGTLVACTSMMMLVLSYWFGKRNSHNQTQEMMFSRFKH